MPRAGLTTGRVVEEAGNVADDCGLANLTLAAIALRLGVRVPSLYKHVDGLAELRGRSFDRLVGALAQSFSTWPPGTAGAAPLPHTEGERHEHHDQHDG